MRIKATVSYDGSDFYGFQKQSGQKVPTVQATVEGVLSQILNTPVSVVGSGRTDRGVHALHQVFHFDTDRDGYDLPRLQYAMNRMLPPTVRICDLERVDDDFHARRSAKRKHYRYRILTRPDPFQVRYALLYLKPLDTSRIREGMKLFCGKHHFYNFCSNRDPGDEYEKEIFEFTLTEKENELVFDIIGTGFKRYMVRMIIGTLLALSDGQIETEYIVSRLNLPLGNTTAYNAPPQGLYLVEVMYDS